MNSKFEGSKNKMDEIKLTPGELILLEEIKKLNVRLDEIIKYNSKVVKDLKGHIIAWSN